MSIAVSISAVRLMHRTLTQMRCRTVAVHRRWYRSLWSPTTLAVESPTDLFVASHWLERSSCRFPASMLVFSRADHSTSRVVSNHLSCGFTSTFYWRLASKAFMLLDLLWLVQLPWRHTPRLLVIHVVFRFLLKIFVYAANASSCSAIRPNY